MDFFKKGGTSGRTRTANLAFFIPLQIYKNPIKSPILGAFVLFAILQI